MAKDLGPVSSDLKLEHIYLLLNRPSETQHAIEDLINQLHDLNSPRYHQWLTASQIVDRFAPAEEDIQTVNEWLESHGFTINVVYRASRCFNVQRPSAVCTTCSVNLFRTVTTSVIVYGVLVPSS